MGAKLVMPGQKVDGESLHRIFEQEAVTFANGVPTVWLGYVATPEEAGVFRHGSAAMEPSDDIMLVYLVELDGPGN
jgi:hypothetical protein